MTSVVTTYKGDMLFETQVGKHKITIDGPKEWGGKDRGPMPPQLFMTSIGSCVGVLVTHFCQEHNLDTEGLKIEVSYDTAQHPTRFEDIKVKLNLPNAHCDDECTAKALEHVAKHCPVHETIMTLEKVMFEISTQ